MDGFFALMDGFGTALQPQYLLLALLGVFVGTTVGVLPGIGPAMIVALLLPYGYPIAPTVVGMILGPMFEAQLRRAVSISQGIR